MALIFVTENTVGATISSEKCMAKQKIQNPKAERLALIPGP